MKPTPWKPYVSINLPFRKNILDELMRGSLSLLRGLKLSYIIYGPLGVGKTSILLSLIEMIRSNAKSSTLVPIYVDCSRHVLTPGDLLNPFLAALSYTGRIEYHVMGEIARIMSSKDVVHLIRMLNEKLIDANIKSLLILDHVEELKHLSRYWDMRLTPKGIIEEIMNSDAIGLICSFTSLNEANNMFGGLIDLFIVRKVDRLNKHDTTQLLSSLLKDIVIDDDSLEWIYELTRGLPLHIHLLAAEILSREVKNISIDVLREIINSALNEPHSILHMGLRIYHHELLKVIRGRNMIVKLLLLISKGISSASSIARSMGRPAQYITEYIRRLIEVDVLAHGERGVIIKDLLYIKWLSKEFPSNFPLGFQP
ncbi:MAG: hypothetical protein DRZ82_01150 [Thermoprotei archaeon]|nr:MAG: hypothetical protein DRZ82_01150 [Thermoprotei archaeon]